MLTFPHVGMQISGCVKINSPRVESNVNPLTPNCRESIGNHDRSEIGYDVVVRAVVVVMQELEIELNNNNICLPSPIVKTSMVELLYMQYPAAISFCPICIGFRSEHSEASLLHSLPSRLRTRGSIPSQMLEWVHSIRRNSHALEQTVERKTCMWYPYPKIVPVVIDASMELLTSKG